jgi:hypothetical protein
MTVTTAESTLDIGVERESEPPTQSAPDEHREPAGFLDTMLDGGEPLDRLLLDEGALPATIHRLLALSIFGLAAHGLVVGLVVGGAEDHIFAWLGQGTPALWMPLTLVAAFLTAIAVGLPSFYFYTRLSGLAASLPLIVAQALRVQARTSVILLGILPFYAAMALTVEFHFIAAETVEFFGLALPFAVGLLGLGSVYRSFRRLVEILPITHERRGNVLLRMVLCWGALVAAIAPVAMWRIGEVLGTWL